MNATDKELLSKINEAVSAEQTAQAEHVSRAKELGFLVLEAKKRHPAQKDFEKFLKPVVGLGLSRAYDLMRLAGGRTTEEELRKEARERQAKSRAKKKKKGSPALPPPQAEPEPPVRDVTDTGEADPEPRADHDKEAQRKAKSARALAEFREACRTYWPRITEEADQQKARVFIDQLITDRAEAA
jgi:hypothetical protein